MTSPTSNTFLENAVSVFSGTAGSVAGTPVGYLPSDANVVIAETKNATPRHVQGKDLPVEYMSRIRELRATIPLMQLDVDLLAIAWGVTKNGLVNTFGNPSVDVRLPQKSYAIVGTDANGTTKRYDIPYGVSVGDTSIDLGQENPTVLNWEIAAVDADGSKFPTYTEGSGNLEATISTAELTRTAAYHKVRSEVGGAADAFATIVGSGLVDEEFLTLQIGSVDEPITLTHGASDLVLISGADFTMTKLTDRVVVQYDLAGTKWDEIERFDDPN